MVVVRTERTIAPLKQGIGLGFTGGFFCFYFVLFEY
jgi:hypothetical protein